MNAAEGHADVGHLQHRHIVGSIADCNDPFEAPGSPEFMNRFTLVQYVVDTNSPVYQVGFGRNAAAAESGRERPDPKIQVSGDQKANFGPFVHELNDLRIESNLVDDLVNPADRHMAQNQSAKPEGMLERNQALVVYFRDVLEFLLDLVFGI